MRNNIKQLFQKRSLWSLCFNFWVFLIIAVYLVIVVNQLHHPFNKSNYDNIFSIYIIGGMLLAAIFCFYNESKSYVLPVALSLVSVVLFFVMAILSKVILSVLVCLWILIIAVVVGEKIVNLMLNRPIVTWLEQKLLAVAVGLGILSLFVLLISVVKLLYFSVILMAMIIATVLLARDIIFLFRTSYAKLRTIPGFIRNSPDFVLTSVLLSFILIMGFINVIGALAPEIQFDSLNYHLTVPKFYIEFHGIVNLPYIMQSYFAKSIEALYTLGMILSGQIVAKLISFCFSVLSVLTLFCIGKRLFSVLVAVLAMALFYLAPLVSWLATTTYIELAVCFYILATLLVFILWQKYHSKPFLFLFGMLAAFSLSAKVHAGLFIFPMGLMVLFFSYLRSKKVTSVFVDVAIFSIPILFLALPWYLITYFQTGNPIFPFFNAVFKSHFLPASNDFMNLKDFGIGYGMKNFLFLPWDLVYNAHKFMEASPNGIVGVSFLLALPVIFFVCRDYRIGFLLFIVVLGTMVWFWVGQYLRYIVPGLAIVCLLGGYVFEYFSSHGKLWLKNICVSMLLLSLLATVPIYLVYFWNIHSRIPYKVALGIESRETYLTNTIRTYGASVFLNRHCDAVKSKVLLIGPEFRYYIDAQSTSPLTDMTLKFSIPYDLTLSSYLQLRGFTHILVDTFAAHEEESKGIIFRAIKREVVDKGHAQLVFKSQYAKLYRLTEQ